METERVTEHKEPATGTAVPPLPPVGTPAAGGAPADSPGLPRSGAPRFGVRSAIPAAEASRTPHSSELPGSCAGGDEAEQLRSASRPRSGAGRTSSQHEAAEGPRGSGTRGGTGRAVPEPSHGGPGSASKRPSRAPSPPPTAESGAVSHPTTGDMTAADVPPAAPSGTSPDPAAPEAATGNGDAAERERRGGDRLRFVGAATRRIARGMDLDETVLGLCRASVPAYSDAILVYLRDPLPVGDERPTGPVVLRLRRSDRIPDDPHAMVAAVSTAERGQDGDAAGNPGTPASGPSLSAVSDGTAGAAEYVEVLNGGPLAEVLRGVRPVFADAPAARDALPELLGSAPEVPSGQRAILAPLRGRRRVIGAAVFLRGPERAPFEPDDLLIAAQLATHTALGVDKAVLYGREAYIADELQRTMLPDELPQPTGCHLASRYLPAAETARVGGDWYDAIPLPGSRVALVVGDVMGHSMTSAAIMGQLRTTAQTLAGLDLPPQEVLHHLDEQAQRLGSDRMATCLYAVYDPVAHRIIIANAGHPPPVLLHRDGRAEVLRIPAGAPIGVGGVDFEAVELDAPAGATLLLYTDGLVESRQRDVWTGIEHLREKLTATARLTRPDASAPLEPLCDEVLDILGPGDRDDDIALLAARFDGIAPSDVAYWFLDPRAQTAGQARRLARRALARWDLEELSDAVELLVSEVVTNAVRYAERPITLRLLRTDTLRCEVGDDVPQLPRLRQARATDEGGRGLYLVNRLARRWGATRLSTGKVVWFELPVN
ncbi:SpoIIE family protein phosphatase [Streptomyces nanshensis]|uniref:protein-serine/threonine phosphatase n=1 Tax=Streptomyces nanshensis TaxID=518642 RepID=A0A1E7L8Q1_9ACTN|nr:SpoIIE family protein phosphatase [Streptomyces nanshensis]OEV12363.1 serine/threonine protein phosphatase [Streptomyces nanshensis]